MPRRSAGILLHRRGDAGVEVLLVHPGGPFWASKDAGAWSIPKGELNDGEEPLASALREFQEETGTRLAPGATIELGEVVQRGGKRVVAWGVEGDLDAATVPSNTFLMEWPPRSGAMREFPEVDRAAWFSIDDAQRKIIAGQRPILNELAERMAKL